MNYETSISRKIVVARAVFVLILSTLGLCGCAIHPLPEDVTRETTFAITRKLRCEARDALDHINIDVLRRHALDSFTRDLATKLENGDIEAGYLINPQTVNMINLDKKGQSLYRTYTLTAVTFDFSFKISEQNDNSVASNFRLPVVGGVFTMGANAGGKFDRQNTRKFQITNSFLTLHNQSRSECRVNEARTSNSVYPIVGRIGIEEVFRTFIDIDSTSPIASDQEHRFSDTLTFMTTLTGGVTPKISLDPSSRREFRVADASAAIKAQRIDEHQVTIAIARGSEFVPSQAAILLAKDRSRNIADAVRIENLLDVQRSAIISLSDTLR